jgi:hypothetical protein
MMSFVITTCSPELVVQVSETRHSDIETKRVISEDLRKTLIVKGRQTHFVLGWVGLASTPFGHHTTNWLFKALGEMNAVELTIEDIAERLGALATNRFIELSTPDKHKHTTFVMAGWQHGEPFFCTVSNYIDVYNRILPSFDLRHHIPTLREARDIFPRFEASIQRFKNIKDRDYVVHVMGDFDPEDLTPHFMGLESLLKKRAPASEISGACMQIALEAAKHSETVGRNLIGVEMDSTGRMMWSFYTETDEALVPSYLGLDGSHTQGSMGLAVTGGEVVVTNLRTKIAKFEKIETKAG